MILSALYLAVFCSKIPSTFASLGERIHITRPWEHVDAAFGTSPAPFNIKVDNGFISSLEDTVRLTRIPQPVRYLKPTDEDGFTFANFTAIRDYWLKTYNWNHVQTSINQQLRQFTTTVQPSTPNYSWSLPLHFVHHRSNRTDAIPLLFIHGWPGSFLEVRRIIDLLTSPENNSAPAFHVVAPSIPGFGFSPAPLYTGFGPREAGHAFNALMQQLGYTKYVIQGGDFGGVILRYQAHQYPDHVVSVLDNFWVTQPNSTDMARFKANETTADETSYITRLTQFIDYDSGYRFVQQNQPLSAAVPLTASPIGFVMWIYTLMRRAVDPRIFDWTAEEIITWSLMYTIQGLYGGLRFYKEAQADGGFAGTGFGSFPYVSQPVAMSEFPYDIWYDLPLDWAQRSGNVVDRYVHDRGGHFAATEVPHILAQDIRKWFGNRNVSGTHVFQ